MSPADKGPSMQPFRFFSLPREMRDAVYDYLVTESKEISSGFDEQDTKVFITKVPVPAMFQANSQLKEEYADYLPSSRKLLVLGGHCDYWTGYPDIAPSLARTVEHCVVYIHVQCYCDNMDEDDREEQDYSSTECPAVDYLQNYGEKLREFLSQFPNMKSAHIRLGLWGARHPRYEHESTSMSANAPPKLSHSNGFTEALGMLVAYPLEVLDMEVVKCTTDEDYYWYCNSKEHQLPTYMTWTRNGGFQPGSLLPKKTDDGMPGKSA